MTPPNVALMAAGHWDTVSFYLAGNPIACAAVSPFVQACTPEFVLALEDEVERYRAALEKAHLALRMVDASDQTVAQTDGTLDAVSEAVAAVEAALKEHPDGL